MDWAALMAEFERFWATTQNVALGRAQPWRPNQLGVLAAAALFAHITDQRLEPRLDAWMRSFSDMDKALLRLLVLVAHHLRSLIFLGLSWAAVLILRASTWPSRSYVIATVASLFTAWIFFHRFALGPSPGPQGGRDLERPMGLLDDLAFHLMDSIRQRARGNVDAQLGLRKECLLRLPW